MKITESLKKKFTRSVEIVPPRNGSKVDVFEMLKVLESLKLDFMSITKGAGGSLRGGTLPISYFAQAKFNINAMAHFTCREIVRERIENSLMDLNYFGIKNVLALRGDAPDMQEDYEWKDGYKYAYQLIRQIKQLNGGKYLARKGFDKCDGEFREGKKTDFCIGVAAHPEEQSGKRVEYLKKKVEEGAEFAMTQMIFDVDKYKSFLDDLDKAGVAIPIIPGVWPLDAKWKLEQAEKKFKVSIPQDIKEKFDGIEDKEEFRKKGIEVTIELCRKFKEAGAPGIHLFIFHDVELAKEIFSKL